MRPGRHLQNCRNGRIFNPPLRVRYGFAVHLVGVGVPIDPRRASGAKPPLGAQGEVVCEAYRRGSEPAITAGLQPLSHGARRHASSPSQGSLRSAIPGWESVGCGRPMAAPTGAVRICGAPCRGRCPHRPAPRKWRKASPWCPRGGGMRSIPEGIRAGNNRRLTTPQSWRKAPCQLPFTGEPFFIDIFCSRPRPARRSGCFPRFPRGL